MALLDDIINQTVSKTKPGNTTEAVKGQPLAQQENPRSWVPTGQEQAKTSRKRPFAITEPPLRDTPPTPGDSSPYRTRAPLRFDQYGNNLNGPRSWERYLNEEALLPAAGAITSLDPVSGVTGGEYNINSALDPFSYLYHSARGQPVGSYMLPSEQEQVMQAATPQWVRQLMDFAMAGGMGVHGVPERPTPAQFAENAMREREAALPEQGYRPGWTQELGAVPETVPAARNPILDLVPDKIAPGKTAQQSTEASNFARDIIAQHGVPQSAPIDPYLSAARGQGAFVEPKSTTPSYMVGPDELQAQRQAGRTDAWRSPEEIKAEKDAYVRAKFGQAQPEQQQQTFVGKKAGFDVRAVIQRAEALEKQGADRDQIWQATSQMTASMPDSELTGAFRGEDGQWRVELHDGRVIVPNEAFPKVSASHIDTRYPHVMRRINADISPTNPLSGAYLPDIMTADIKAGSAEAARGVVAHEYQHGIQHAEGFAHGGSRGQFTPEEVAAEQERLRQNPEPMDWTRVSTLDPNNPDSVRFKMYQDLPGEREARKVQSRAHMSLEERRASPPWYDQNPEQQPQSLHRSAQLQEPKFSKLVPGWKDFTQKEKNAYAANWREEQNKARVDSLKRVTTQATTFDQLKEVLGNTHGLEATLPPAEARYYGELNRYFFKAGLDKQNSMTQAYLRLTDGQVNMGVPFKRLYESYQQVLRDVPEERRGAKHGNTFYEKDERSLRRHLGQYGRNIGERFPEEVPEDQGKPVPVPWLLDPVNDTVYLSPYVPNAEGVRAIADTLPLEVGLRATEPLPKVEPLVPEVPKGRVAQQAHPVQQQQGKPPSKRPPSTPADFGAPIEPTDIKGPKRRGQPAGRRLAGETLRPEDYGSRGRAGASGADVSAKKPNQQPPFRNATTERGWAGRKWAEIEKILSPSSISDRAEGSPARAAARMARAIEGTGRRQTLINQEKMEPFIKAVVELPEAAKEDLVHYIQTGGEEGALADLRKTHPKQTRQFEAFARELANIYKGYENEIRALPANEKLEFMKNYLPQLFKLTAEQRARAKTFLKTRRIPTYRDAKAEGLEPVTRNPIDLTFMYMGAMRKFLDVRHIVQEGERDGYIRKYDGRRKTPPNTRSLDFGGKGGAAYYANEDFARVFNNYVSRGFNANPEIGSIYNGLLRLTNASTSMQLGISAFHAMTMAKESYLAAISDGVKALSKGKPITAAAKFAKSPAAAYTYFEKGRQLMDAYLERGAVSPEQEHLAQLAARANMRLGEMDEVYRASAMGAYAKSIGRKLMGEEVKQAGRNIMSSAKEGTSVGSRAVRGGYAAGKEALTAAGRLIDTVAYPLFGYYIPRLKAGVFMERMSDWLKDNPEADMKAQVTEAQRIADVVDDQFGELVQNNLFWHNGLKQTANLMLTSTGWTLGTLRLFGQGTADLMRTAAGKQNLTDRAAYVIATAVGVSMLNLLYQGVKSGLGPTSVRDAIVPQTGGQDVHGAPERALLPGYEKDLMGWWHDPVGEAYNKLGVIPKTAIELASNKDWRTDPIRDRRQDSLTQALQAAGHALSTLEPISVKSAGAPTSPNTNISGPERFLGIRAAGQWISNPERQERVDRYFENKSARTKQRHEAADKRRQGGGVTVVPKSKGMLLDDLLGSTPSKPKSRGVLLDDVLR